MRENTEQFFIMEEQDMAQKVMDIAGRCYPNESYDMTAAIRFKKLAARHLSTLEHGNAIFEVSREMYKNFMDFVHIYETSWTKPVLDHFCFTNFGGRYLMSGTFRDWYLLARCMHMEGQRTVMGRNGFDIINRNVGYILDDFLGRPAGMKEAPIKVIRPETLTEMEALVHVRQTIKFVVSRDMSREFLKFREASIDEVPYPLTHIDPLFFGGKPGELAFDVHFEAVLMWEKLVEQSKKAYDKFMELGMKSEVGVPLMSAFSVVSGSAGTELYMTANLTHWVDIFRKVTGQYAVYEVKNFMIPVLQDMYKKYPIMDTTGRTHEYQDDNNG